MQNPFQCGFAHAELPGSISDRATQIIFDDSAGKKHRREFVYLSAGTGVMGSTDVETIHLHVGWYQSTKSRLTHPRTPVLRLVANIQFPE